MTVVDRVVAAEPVRYEFETGTVQRPVHTFAGVLSGSWRRAFCATLLALLAAQFLVTPLAQMRSQVVAARELAARLDTAKGAVGMADLSPLPNEPLAAGTSVALLKIPRLGLSQVVLEGADGGTLQHGPGHVTGTAGIAEPGISVVAGRRAAWGAPFARIPSLKPGDTLSTTTVAGTMAYRVTSVSAVAPDLRAQTGSGSRLILVTSTPAGLAMGDVYVIADSARAAFPPSPQGRLSDAGVRAGSTGEFPLAVLWIGGLVLVAALARFWVLAGFMDRVLAWTVAAPLIVFCGFMALKALAQALPATL